MEARDDVTATPKVTCTAPLRGAPTEVTAATAFPHGVTVVTCSAKDDAGNESPRVSWAAVVACASGYAFNGTACSGGRGKGLGRTCVAALPLSIAGDFRNHLLGLPKPVTHRALPCCPC
jgi:hypothetical protein